MKHSKSAYINRILAVIGAAMLMVLSVFSIQKAFLSSVALEQAAQCGVEEHCHSESCYKNGSLRCEKLRHTHNQNCYLLLLKDNNINDLLTQIDGEENHSLETLIYNTVGEALNYNTDLSAVGAPVNPVAEQINAASVPQSAAPIKEETLLVLSQAPQQEATSTVIQSTDIAALNETITTDTATSGLVLNENLSDATLLSETPNNTISVLNLGASSGVSTLSVGDTASSKQNKANFYVYLDGEWQCFGVLDFSVVNTTNNRWYRTAQVSTSNVVNLVNSSLGTNYTYNNLNLVYGASANASSWTNAGIGSSYITFGTDYFMQDSAKQAKYVRLVDSNRNAIAFYTVTFRNLDGSEDIQYVQANSNIILPDGNSWTAGANIYAGGETVTITAATTFVATDEAAASKIRISYNVNFPTLGFKFGDNDTVYNPASPPTLAGTSVTSITDSIEENASATVRAVSSNVVTAETTHNYGVAYPVRFMGWETESGEIISANTNLSWSALEVYANGDRTVSLKGVWLHSTQNMVNFFVLYNARVDETTGTSDLYTPSIFTSHVGGTIDTSIALDARTDEVAYENDGIIRAMYGPTSGDMWLDTFPDDDYIFQQLRQYATSLTVEGEQVNSEDLNSGAYAIRWYKFQHFSDGWHIDGKLTKKKGQITVNKEFFGDANTIAQAKNGFYITATNAAGTKQHVLTLTTATANSLTRTYPNADFQVDADGQWLIEDVLMGEVWTIEEHPVSVDGTMYYAEYSAYDTDGNTTAVAEYGTTATVTGKTFALDQDPDQGLLVDFRNYYYPSESILIKKEDHDTGQPIGNAVFELWQYNSENVLTPLTFSYDSVAGQYRYDNNGSLTRISTGDAGFTTITTTGFSYNHGPVVVKEVIAPTGYAAAPNVTLTSQNNIVSITDMTYGNGTVVPQAQWPGFAEVYQDGSTLIVKNHSTALTSLTVDKIWADNVSADSVTVVLQANGSTATSLFPGLSNVRAVLSATNNWQHTWENLPTYANGAPVQWSVKEILVGNETTTADGVSFANWIAVYSQPTQTDTDGDGITDHWHYTVTNSVRRAQLYLIKANPNGEALEGASFELVEVDSSGNPVSGAIIHSGTTNGNGMLQLDNLKYSTRYRLIETSPPNGYLAYKDPAYLSLAADGTVLVEDHSQVSSGSVAYVVHVVNYAPLPLPTTGGSGTGIFYRLGGAFMLLAACRYILLKRKHGRRESSG